MKNTKKIKLNAEEQALSNSSDRGEWISAKNIQQEINAAKKVAKNTLRKDTRINIQYLNITSD